MTTIENIMALANAYAESYRDALAPNANALVDEAQTALRTALTEALAQPIDTSQERVEKTDGNVQVSADLIRQAATELRQQCGGRCNAEYNPCWSLELADKLQCAVKQPNISEYPEKDISVQPAREPLQDALAWELWLNAVDTANNTGRLVAYTYKEAIERAHNIRGEK